MGDVTNKFGVGIQPATGGVQILALTGGRLIPKEDALNLAAWIVAVADPLGEDFEIMMEQVMAT